MKKNILSTCCLLLSALTAMGQNPTLTTITVDFTTNEGEPATVEVSAIDFNAFGFIGGKGKIDRWRWPYASDSVEENQCLYLTVTGLDYDRASFEAHFINLDTGTQKAGFCMSKAGTPDLGDECTEGEVEFDDYEESLKAGIAQDLSFFLYADTLPLPMEPARPKAPEVDTSTLLPYLPIGLQPNPLSRQYRNNYEQYRQDSLQYEESIAENKRIEAENQIRYQIAYEAYREDSLRFEQTTLAEWRRAYAEWEEDCRLVLARNRADFERGKTRMGRLKALASRAIECTPTSRTTHGGTGSMQSYRSSKDRKTVLLPIALKS